MADETNNTDRDNIAIRVFQAPGNILFLLFLLFTHRVSAPSCQISSPSQLNAISAPLFDRFFY